MDDSTKLPWRVGSHYGIHIYAVAGYDNGDDIPVGTMFTVALAREAVEAHNARLVGGDDTDG